MNIRFWFTHPWLLPIRLQYFVWEKLNPDKPWMCPGTVRFCEKHLDQSMQALEFGSGRSTTWFGRQVRHLTSVEHDRNWYEVVTRQLTASRLTNVDYRFVPLDQPEAEKECAECDPMPSYVRVADDFAEGSLDLIIIDGRYRNHCIRRSLPKLKPGGFLVIDDVNYWPTIRDIPVPGTWEIVDESSNGLKRCIIWRAKTHTPGNVTNNKPSITDGSLGFTPRSNPVSSAARGLFLRLFKRVPAKWIQTAGALRGKSAWIKAMTDWLPNLLRNREGCIQKGLGCGLRFNSANSALGFLLGTHDLDVQFILSRLLKAGQTCYDIGANVGFTAVLAARQVGPSGRVICFEPLASNSEQIRHNAQLNDFDQIDVHCLALGNSDGEAEFHVSVSPTWGRLAQAGSTPLQSGVLRVPLRRLDSLVADDEVPDPQFIKMDVEGAEADVITGGKELLARARPLLVIELHHTYQAVVNALQGLDYVVRPLTPGGDTTNTEGEFQILAYPRERTDVEPTLAELSAGRIVFA